MRRYRLFSALLLPTLLACQLTSAVAQSRLSDKDVEHLMQNLSDDAQSFQDPFKDALSRSAIRKTSREKDARALSKRLTAQTNGLLDTFRHRHHPEAALQSVNAMVSQIDPIVASFPQDSKATQRWDRVHADLQALAPAFNLSTDTAPPAASSIRSCASAVGRDRAAQLVAECVQVSPATHPPCNAQNSCALITDEIRRSCALIGNDAPRFCAEYR